MNLKGKKALVTGGAKRIGREIALALARGGADVAIGYHRSANEARKTVAAIRQYGVKGAALAADLSRGDGARRLVRAAIRQLGGLDILINNASVFEKTPLATVSSRDWDHHIDTNLKGPFLCAVEAGRWMMGMTGMRGLRAQGRGVIINIADRAATRPYKGYIPYSVSKAGLVALTQALALELAPTVRVNAVSPGAILFPTGYSTKLKRRLTERIPLGRLGSPADIARGVIFLIESDFATGANLVIDGGQTLGS